MNLNYSLSLIIDAEREEQLQKMKVVIKKLPELNYSMLEYLLDFLDTMTRDSDDNLMTSENLAICFGPGLLHRKEENIGQLMKESGFVTNIVTALIDQYGFFFRVSYCGIIHFLCKLTLSQLKEEGIDEDQEENTALKRQGTDFSAFITVSLQSLSDSSKQISDLLNKLEWAKLWSADSLGHVMVMEELFKGVRNIHMLCICICD